jgi:SAM-dependent methyltransferase
MGLGIKTFLSYKIPELLGRSARKFEGHYNEWRTRRILAILDQYGHRFFDGKTVLEVGAGFGDIGAVFALLGARVTCLEGRASNVREIRRRYPFLEARQHDLSAGLPGEQYDVLIHMGVLYHLAEPEPAMRAACRCCRHLILETEVCDSDDPGLVLTAPEHSYIYDQALHGTGCRPSPALLERIMTEEKMGFTRITDARCNSGLHSYDWPVKNEKTYRSGLRRMWFGERK